MMPRLYIGLHPTNETVPEDVLELLDAAADFEREFDAEPGIVLRQLTEMLRKQAEFNKLKTHFGVSFPDP